MTLAIQQRINDGPMSSYQMFVIGICVAINMLDGFDGHCQSKMACASRARFVVSADA